MRCVVAVPTFDQHVRLLDMFVMDKNHGRKFVPVVQCVLDVCDLIFSLGVVGVIGELALVDLADRHSLLVPARELTADAIEVFQVVHGRPVVVVWCCVVQFLEGLPSASSHRSSFEPGGLGTRLRVHRRALAEQWLGAAVHSQSAHGSSCAQLASSGTAAEAVPTRGEQPGVQRSARWNGPVKMAGVVEHDPGSRFPALEGAPAGLRIAVLWAVAGKGRTSAYCPSVGSTSCSASAASSG